MQQVSSIPRLNDMGPDVKVLQEALNRAALTPLAPLKVDGIFGPVTKQYVGVFQMRHGMGNSGVPGKETLAALGISVGEIETPPHGGSENSGSPDTSPSGKITRDTIASKIVAIISADVAAKMRETNGKNRSPRIDSFNKRVGASMGSPYCASGIWCAIDDACKSLGLKNPVHKTASSQDFRKSSFVPAKYIREEGRLGRIGDVGVLQVAGDSGHGHLTLLRADQKAQPIFLTVEYNTDASGSRDGDGAYASSRSTVDKDKVNSGKLFISFADVPSWILDANS